MTTDVAKRAAATAAADEVADGMTLGLGTGSTVDALLQELAVRGAQVRGVPTSEATARRSREFGFTLLSPDDVAGVDLAIDGADELDDALRLTKGGGGALLREKVVASMARRFVVIATVDKLVERLGRSFPLPVEVVPFAVGPVTRQLEAMGFTVTPRASGSYRTDNGNVVLDCRHEQLDDPDSTDIAISLLPGVVCSGLFIDLADQAYLGTPDGDVRVLPAS